MGDELNIESLPYTRISHPLKIILEGREIIGQGEKLSLKEIVGRFTMPWTPGRVGQLILDFADFEEQFSVRVVEQESRPSTGNAFTTRFQILAEEPQARERLIRCYINALWRDVTDKVPQGDVDVIWHNLVGTFGHEEISSILKEVFPRNTKCYVVIAALKRAVRMVFEDRWGNTFSFKPLSAMPSEFLLDPEGRAFVFWAAGFRQYLFMGSLKERSAQKATIVKPVFLLTTSLRQEERTKIDEGSMWVEIPLPYPRGAILRREIIDVSSGGFSFICPPDACYFLAGTPISSMRIVSQNSEPFIASGQIRHVTAMRSDTGGTYLKIGVQFQISNKAFAKGHIQPKVTPVPSQRVDETAAKRPLSITHITQTLSHLLERGLRLSYKRSLTHEPLSLQESRIFRQWNQKHQEIVGLLNTTWSSPERRRSTVIVVPPPYGKRKEALGLFAQYVLARFRRQYHDAVIVRYDASNTVGESYKDPECRHPGKDALHMTLSQGTQDLLSILDFVERNEYFLPREVVIVSFSLGALCARKAILKDDKKRVHLWIAPMGVTHMDDLMFRVSGGIDYFGLYESGKDLGDVIVLGNVVNGDRFCRDALKFGYATMENATQDMSQIGIPVIWLYGVHDAWLDPENVEKLLKSKEDGFQRVRILPTGHLPLNGKEALGVFDAVFQELWPQLSPEPLAKYIHNLSELKEKQESEWQRVPREAIPSKRRYWASYLLGTRKNEIGYDILRYCEEYVDFIQDQINLLDLQPGQLVADLGCGTGNFVLQVLENYRDSALDFPRFVLVDIVPEALARVGEKCEAAAAEQGIPMDRFQYHEVDLDIHPVLPLKKFILGEYSSLDQLKGQIPGLTDYSIDLWKKEYGPRLHQILRGKILTDRDRAYLEDRFPETEKEVLLEFNLATKILRGILLPNVFSAPICNESLPDMHGQEFYHLRLELSKTDFCLPFSDNYFDRIVSSLVLSYLKNPQDTLAEYGRILKPNGVLVVSSMKPDTDISKIYSKMINRLRYRDISVPESQKEKLLIAIRNFANSAANLLQLVEERRFRFFHPEDLLDMVEAVGLKTTILLDSYGNPPQAHIVQCRK